MKLKMCLDAVKKEHLIVYDELTGAAAGAAHPIHHCDVNCSLSRPRTRRNRVRDRPAVRNDVIESRLARVSNADAACSDEPGPATTRQSVVRTSEPIRTVVRSAPHSVERFLESFHVGCVQLPPNAGTGNEGRIADDGIDFGPVSE